MIIPKILYSERIIIRPIDVEDFDEFKSFMKNSEATKYMNFEDYHKTDMGIISLFNHTINSYEDEMSMASFAIVEKEEEKYIGSVGFAKDFINPDDIQLYWLISPEYWRKGYGYEGVSTFIDYVTNTSNRYIRAYVDNNDIASIKLAKKLTMKDNGVDFIYPLQKEGRCFEL